MGIMTGVMLAGVVVAAAVLLARQVLAYLHFRRLELAIPGPPTTPLFGNGLDFLTATSDNVLQVVFRLIGNRHELKRVTIFNHMIVFVSDPEEIRSLVRHKDFGDKSHLVYDLLHVVAKRGLIQMSGPDWKAHRRVLEPSFHKHVLDRFVDIFSAEAVAFVQTVDVNREVDLLKPLRRASVRTFLRTTITDAALEKYEEQGMAVIQFLEVFLRSIKNRCFNPLLWSETLFNLTPTGRLVQKMKGTIEELVKGLLATKREAQQQQQQKTQRAFDFIPERETLGDILAAHWDRDSDSNSDAYKMTQEDILDEVKTFYGASVETTVSSLSWMLKVLSLQPQIQEKVYAELIAVLGPDHLVISEHLPRLEYTECFVKEAMRMFPAILVVGRQAHKEVEFCGRVIPAGSSVGINIIGAHYDERHWPEPTRFDPDRFLPENSKDRHPCAFLPFSTGSRNCIGGQYAMMNMKTFLATTLRAYRVERADDGHHDLQSLKDNMTFDLASRLAGGTKVILIPRGVVAT